MFVWHCALAVHARPTAHRPQVALPQSTTGSVPFRTPSLQAGAWQQVAVPAGQPTEVQTSLWQSVRLLQAKPVVHVSLQMPPQSSAVSF
jgi:hypothetical protein